MCCCIDDNNIIDDDVYCCCRLYSYSLQGSIDNKNWELIHKVEKDANYKRCMTKTIAFAKTKPYNYVRLVMDEPVPGCTRCMVINQIELYGETIANRLQGDSSGFDEGDESVSIIGKLSRSY